MPISIIIKKKQEDYHPTLMSYEKVLKFILPKGIDDSSLTNIKII
jgi:hypothetical protein